jgi:hypothetical protein
MTSSLTAHDRCDRCSAQAVVVFGNDLTEWQWCGHHSHKYEEALLAAGFEITIDQRTF